MAQAPFVWGPGGQQMTPREVERRRKLAEQMILAGSDASPIQHWTQGLARLAQGFLGGQSAGRAREAEQAGLASAGALDQQIAALLAGGGAPAAAVPGAVPAPVASVPLAAPAGAGGPGAPWLDILQQAESGGNPTAANPRSSARGAFQFIDGTWREFARANPELFTGMDDAAIMAARNDPALSRQAAAWYADQNSRSLAEAGLPVEPATLATAHVFGPAGAQALLSADPATPAIRVLGESVMRANPNWAGRTAGEVVAEFQQRYGGAQPAAQARAAGPDPVAVAMANPPAAPQAQQAAANPEAALLSGLANPWVSDGQRSVVQALVQDSLRQRREAADPLRQAQIANLESQAANRGSGSEAEQRIARLTEEAAREFPNATLAQARALAVGVTDGRLVVSRDPITQVAQVVDKFTGQPWGGLSPGVPPAAQAAAPQPAEGAVPVEPGVAPPSQFPDAPNAFGVPGFAADLINRGADVIGGNPPFPQNQETQAQFRVFRESLLNDIARTYGRQPPSWLLQEIRNLTPSAGSPFEGPAGAQSKLRGLRSSFEQELATQRESLERALSPQNRQEVESRIGAINSALRRVDSALQSFAPQPAAGPTPGSSAEPPPAGGPRRVTTRAEYDALPRGTEYQAPDGTMRRKP